MRIEKSDIKLIMVFAIIHPQGVFLGGGEFVAVEIPYEILGSASSTRGSASVADQHPFAGTCSAHIQGEQVRALPDAFMATISFSE